MKKCATCGKNRDEKFYVSERGRVCHSCRRKKRSESAHNLRVSRTYGMDAGDYERLLVAQTAKCAICVGDRPYRLDVDHDHKTGYVRGLLCKRCNREILKAARDDADLLRKAAAYLDDPPAPKAIGYKKAHGA